jgi:acyl carrier protein
VTSSALTRSAEEEGSIATNVCALIAEHLEIDIESVTADTHFTDDLGMDLFDVVELMLLIEARFTNVQITDHDAEIEFVGDLVRHIEIVDDAKARPKTDDPATRHGRPQVWPRVSQRSSTFLLINATLR